jgi:hypothetical protein
MSANLDSDISRHLKTKNAAVPAAPSRIEDYAAQIARIVAEGERLNALNDQLRAIGGRKDKIGMQASLLQTEFEHKLREMAEKRDSLEDLLVWETPRTVREAFLLMILVGYRADNLDDDENRDAVNAVRRLVGKIALFLEEQSGTTAEELGLGNFIIREQKCYSEPLEEKVSQIVQRDQAEPCQEAASC